jgi:PilZ domain
MSEGTGLLSERRTAIRYRAESSSPLLAVVQNDHHRPAALHDISAEGVGLLLDRALEPGQVIRVEIHSCAKHCWYLKKARVVHAQQQVVGGWLTGISFLIKFDEADVPALFGEYALVPGGAVSAAISESALPALPEAPQWRLLAAAASGR